MFFHAAFQDIRLDGRSERDHFVGVKLGMRPAAEKLLDHAPHQRHARGTAHEHHFVDIRGLQARIRKRHLHRTHGAVEDRLYDPLEFRARKFAHVRAAIGQRHHHRRTFRKRKLVFGANQRFAQLLHSFRMLLEIESVPDANLVARHGQ